MIGSSILVTLLTLFAGLASLLNQLVMAHLFGASMNMDAYLIAVSLPLLVSGVLLAVLSYSLVPALMIHSADQATYRRFSGLLLICLTGASILIALCGFFTTPMQIAILGAPLSAQSSQEALVMARISWITVGLSLVIGHLAAMHNAARSFLLPVIANILPYIGMILFGLLYGPDHGPLAVTWGMLAGSIGAIAMLQVRVRPSLDLTTRCLSLWQEVRTYLSRIPLMLLAMLCFTVYQSIDAYWAPRVGTGNLAYLGYAQRILVAIGTLVIAGPSAVLLPRLAQAHAEGRGTDLLDDTGRTVRTVIAFALPAALFISLLAKPLVQLVFERGAFTHQATQSVAAILPFMMTGMIAMLCVVIIFRALFAKHDITAAAQLGLLAAGSYFALSGVLSKLLGVQGIALAYALSWWLVLCLSAFRLWRGHVALLLSRENGVFVRQIVIIFIAISGVAIAGKVWISISEATGAALLLQLGVIASLATAVYLTVAIRLLRISEVHQIYSFMYAKIYPTIVGTEKKVA